MRKKMPHCEIHIFDPTTLPDWEGKWNYHHVGLGGEDNDAFGGHTGSDGDLAVRKKMPHCEIPI